MNHWIYAANTKIYKVLDALSQEQAAWPINSKTEVGDIVYLYLSAPYKQIGFVCKIKEINLDEKTVRDYTTPYVKDAPEDKPANKAFMMLANIRPIPKNPSSPLSYENLKRNGLKGMLMGPRKLENAPGLLSYINDHVAGLLGQGVE